MRITPGQWWTSLAYGSPEWENYAVEVRGFLAETRPAELSPMLMLEFRVDLARTQCTRYKFEISTSSSIISRQGDAATCPWQNLGWSAHHRLLKERWYSLRVEAYGSLLRGYVDGKLAVGITHTELERGYIAVNVRPGDTVYYDDVRVTELISAPTSQ
jgi:hypothetical protein